MIVGSYNQKDTWFQPAFLFRNRQHIFAFPEPGRSVELSSGCRAGKSTLTFLNRFQVNRASDHKTTQALSLNYDRLVFKAEDHFVPFRGRLSRNWHQRWKETIYIVLTSTCRPDRPSSCKILFVRVLRRRGPWLGPFEVPYSAESDPPLLSSNPNKSWRLHRISCRCRYRQTF